MVYSRFSRSRCPGREAGHTVGVIEPRPPSPRRIDGTSDPELDSILTFARDRATAQRERLVAAGALPAIAPQRSSVMAKVAGLVEAGRTAAGSPAPTTAGGAPGVLLSREDVSPSVGVFRIGRPLGFQFVAGQAVKIGVGAVTRSYTIASAPAAPYLELCVERVPGGALTSQLFALAPGARVAVAPKPRGSLVLDTSAAAHLMVATVTGVAPFISMLRDVLPRAPQTRVIVIHGARAEEDLVYRAELEDLAARHAGFDFLSVARSPRGPHPPPAARARLARSPPTPAATPTWSPT
jgi:ferredoxin-NADP reductase